MRLTRAQQHLLDDGTESQRKAMQILLAVGRLADAPRLVPITSAHVSGVSYKLIGDPGLEFLEDFARDARVSVPTTVNPLGTDLAQWQALDVPPTFAEKQGRIARAYEAMGVQRSFTCTPYLIGIRPTFGEHVAWAESSAVCFANSVLGARTNREGGPAALAAAIVGATPEYGLHTDEGREPTVIVKVGVKPRGIDYSLIGLVAGERVGDGLPFFRGFRGTEGDLKWLGAALASSGACAMFHLEGVTPESRRARVKGLKTIAITHGDLAAAKRAHTDGTEAEMIGLGSPQLSSNELREVARLIDRAPPRIPVWVFTSRVVRDANPDAVGIIERRGGRVLADTCLEVTLLEHRFGTVATPSGKGAYYLPSLSRQKVVFEELDTLLERYA
ncbi:MAG TPA: aconitase X catalytic domain-containing protein [Thermoplasmata archaeon]|nr:aconitase X catalytic domain-containing protein [Thermoplasmata archaeon]